MIRGSCNHGHGPEHVIKPVIYSATCRLQVPLVNSDNPTWPYGGIHLLKSGYRPVA